MWRLRDRRKMHTKFYLGILTRRNNVGEVWVDWRVMDWLVLNKWFKVVLGLSGPGCDWKVAFFWTGGEPSASTNCGNHTDEKSDRWFLEQKPATWYRQGCRGLQLSPARQNWGLLQNCDLYVECNFLTQCLNEHRCRSCVFKYRCELQLQTTASQHYRISWCVEFRCVSA